MEDSIEIEGQFDASDWKNSLVSREVEQKPVLKKLTVEDIPDGYYYAAVDKSGNAHAYTLLPLQIDDCWMYVKRLCKKMLIGCNFDASDWKNSLISREVEQKPVLKKLAVDDIPDGYLYATVDRIS